MQITRVDNEMLLLLISALETRLADLYFGLDIDEDPSEDFLNIIIKCEEELQYATRVKLARSIYSRPDFVTTTKKLIDLYKTHI